MELRKRNCRRKSDIPKKSTVSEIWELSVRVGFQWDKIAKYTFQAIECEE